VISGLGYLLLAPGLASAVYVSGVLLVIFVCATGIALRSRDVGVIGPGRPGTRTAAVVPDVLPSMVMRDAGDTPAR
jgi:hypothetical protein